MQVAYHDHSPWHGQLVTCHILVAQLTSHFVACAILKKLARHFCKVKSSDSHFVMKSSGHSLTSPASLLIVMPNCFYLLLYIISLYP